MRPSVLLLKLSVLSILNAGEPLLALHGLALGVIKLELLVRCRSRVASSALVRIRRKLHCISSATRWRCHLLAILDLLIVLSWCGILLTAEVLFMLKACHRIGNHPSGLRFLNYYRVVLMVSRGRWRLKVCCSLVDVN